MMITSNAVQEGYSGQFLPFSRKPTCQFFAESLFKPLQPDRVKVKGLLSF